MNLLWFGWTLWLRLRNFASAILSKKITAIIAPDNADKFSQSGISVASQPQVSFLFENLLYFTQRHPATVSKTKNILTRELRQSRQRTIQQSVIIQHMHGPCRCDSAERLADGHRIALSNSTPLGYNAFSQTKEVLS